MRGVLRSPRKRRRLAWSVAVPLAVAAVVAAAVAWMPEAKPDPPEVFGEERAVNIAAREKAVRLTKQDRREVNRVIDLLMNAGVKRRNPDAVWNISTRGLRSQASRREWRRGDIPVYPYPAEGKRFHGWTINYSHRNHLNVDLLVMPSRNKANLGPVALTLDLRKVRRRWMVDGIFPVATFAPIPPQGNRGPVISTYDLIPAAAGARPTGARSRLSHVYFVLPAAIIGGGIVFVVGFFLWRGFRDRQAQRRYAAQRA